MERKRWYCAATKSLLADKEVAKQLRSVAKMTAGVALYVFSAFVVSHVSFLNSFPVLNQGGGERVLAVVVVVESAFLQR